MKASFTRNIKPGTEYDKLFPVPDFTETTLIKDGNVDQTVKEMAKYIHKYQADTAKLAPILKGKDLEETLRNDWDFVYHHIQYKLDKPGFEQLRRPARAWAERKTGLDCDCYTIFLSTLLLNQGITPTIRVVQIPPATSFHHVYPIVKIKGGYFVLDAVLDKFNDEKPFQKHKDYEMTSLGIPIVGLHGIPVGQTDIDILLNGPSGLSGDDATLEKLKATLSVVEKNKTAFSTVDNPDKYIADLKSVIDNWNTPARDAILDKLIADESMNGVLGDTSDLAIMDEDQLEGWAGILEGLGDSFTSVVTGDDLGAVLDAKAFRYSRKAAGLQNKMQRPGITPAMKSRTQAKLNAYNRLQENVTELKKLDPAGREKLARSIRQTYQPAKKVVETEPKDILPSDYPGFGPDYNNNMVSQGYKFPEQFAPDYQNDYPYVDEPYDEINELAEDYVDQIEDLEDSIGQIELDELDGLGYAGLGAFWHKKAKRLALKEKRVEKRLAKAEKKGDTAKIENLKKTLDKNKKKQDGTWKEDRKTWRKDNKRGFWNGVKKGLKDMLLKFNPAVAMIRAGFLLALRMNIKKMANRLKWAFATESEATKAGLSKEKWEKTKGAYEKVKKLFADKMGGSEGVLRQAIIKGGKGLHGFEGFEGLGELGFPPIAAALAAAASVIAAVVKILKSTGIMKDKDEKEGESSEATAEQSAAQFAEILKSGNMDAINKSTADVSEDSYDTLNIDLPEEEPKPWYKSPVAIVGGSLLGLGILATATYFILKPKKATPHRAVNGLAGTKRRKKILKEITLT